MIGFLGLGMAAAYLLGRRLAGGTVGVAAALLFGSAPFVVFSTLRFQLDLPLAAMVTLALAVLLATDASPIGRWRSRSAWCAGSGCSPSRPSRSTCWCRSCWSLRAGPRPARRSSMRCWRPWWRPCSACRGSGRALFGLHGAARRALVQAGRRSRASGAAQPGAALTFYPDVAAAAVRFRSPSCSSRWGSSSPRWRRQWLLLGAVLAPFLVLRC